MLTSNADGLTAENLLVYRCGLTADTYAGGLVGWVGGEAVFQDIFLSHFNLVVHPDRGGSGFALAFTGMLGQEIYASASFENISLYECNAISVGSAVLCSGIPAAIKKCANISMECCSLLGEPMSLQMFPPSELLFYHYLEKPVFEENVRFNECVLHAYSNVPGQDGNSRYQQGPGGYMSRGYSFDHCIFLSLEQSNGPEKGIEKKAGFFALGLTLPLSCFTISMQMVCICAL